MEKNFANILTSFRILGSILLLFFPVFSGAFYSIYFFCGFSDMIDGTIARKTNSASEFGTKMDSVADLVFVAASSIKLLSAIHIPGWLWIWVSVITIIKIGNIIRGYVSKKTVYIPTYYNEQGYRIAIVSFTFNLIFCGIEIQFTRCMFNSNILSNSRRSLYCNRL